MLTHTLLPFMLAAVALAQPDPDVPRPTPSPNANPTDTANPRLIGKRFPFDNLPDRADTGDGPRGIQVGFNRCNATTEGPTSMCQTAVLNSIEDFCLFSSPTLIEIGSSEAGTVSYCSKKGHGGRLMPQGALLGVQVLHAPSYMAIVGRIDPAKFNIPAGDGGGELDSGGQDGRGNPLGGLVYSNARGKGYEQVVVWHEFIGDNLFCTKLCWNDMPNASNMCEHRYDTFGCGAVIAANYERLVGVFETCDSDDQIPPRPNTVLPLPATSNCRPVQSAAIYTDGPTVSGGPTTSGPAPTGSASSSGTPRPGGPGGNPSTTSPGGSNPSNTNPPGGSAVKLGGSSVVAFVGVLAGLAGWAIVA